MPRSLAAGAGSGMRGGSQPFRIGLPFLGALTAAAVALTAAVTAAGAHATTGASGGAVLVEAVARGIIVGVPLAAALYACTQRSHAAFGKVFLAASAVWFLGSLASSSSPLLYSVGRVWGWAFEVLLGYALLAFPGGRLAGKVDRAVVAVAAAVLLALYLPSALFELYPSPSPVSACYTSCPHNAFMVVARAPAFIHSSIHPAREVLTALIYLTVAARLFVRIRGANQLMRRMLVPVLTVMIVRTIVYAALFAARPASEGSVLTETLAWILAFTVPALAVAFLAGLVRWHLFVSRGVRIVNSGLRDMPSPEEVQGLVASAFDDLKLRIASWAPRRQRWIGVSGEVVEEPAPGSGRYLANAGGGRRRIAIIHDVALRDDPMFFEAAAAAASVAFESDRVAAHMTRMVSELQASRARIAAAADEERRRIERDLHDGAQQRLLTLAIHLQLAAEQAEHERPEEAAELVKLADEVEQALRDMRSFTHDIYPSILVDRGLETAVRSVAWRSLVPTTVEADGLGEYPREITTAVYFCCAEALQNIAKHARDARSATIALREANSVLRFSVCDDGVGMIDTRARVGAGLINMEDRVATVGGRLTIRSRPGQGTCVSGRIPVSALARPSGQLDTQHRVGAPRTARRRDRTSS